MIIKRIDFTLSKLKQTIPLESTIRDPNVTVIASASSLAGLSIFASN